tara:strand:+ start:306 stop:893 length:588 start_codon:yes stop_codon:yes gene_type:complete
MKQLTTLITILFISFLSSPSWSKSEVDLVEIKLLNNLDDKRGFCIDIKGHKFRAKISRGIQAHTCYSYQGEIAVDQGLDVNKLKQKQLFFPYFDVCVHPTSSKNPLNLNLLKCDNTEEFVFSEDNTIRLKNNTNLCLTVAEGNSRKGGGGSPIHLIRNLSMQTCNQQNSVYKTWGIRGFKKGKVFTKKISKLTSN